MNILEVAQLCGLESYPKLDDIPELKGVLTLGVLIKLKEKYEIPEKEDYSDIEFSEYIKRYRFFYVKFLYSIESYEFIIKDGKFYELRNNKLSPSRRGQIICQTIPLIIPLFHTIYPISEEDMKIAMKDYIISKRFEFLNM